MTDKTGGPAFPHLNPNYDGNWDKQPQRGGMTLRDWMAGMALQGMLANDQIDHRSAEFTSYAVMAFGIADAMIKERKS